jgi:hypothetical protein
VLAAGLTELAAFAVAAVRENTTAARNKKVAHFLPRQLCVCTRALLQDSDLFMASPGKICNDE